MVDPPHSSDLVLSPGEEVEHVVDLGQFGKVGHVHVGAQFRPPLEQRINRESVVVEFQEHTIEPQRARPHASLDIQKVERHGCIGTRVERRDGL